MKNNFKNMLVPIFIIFAFLSCDDFSLEEQFLADIGTDTLIEFSIQPIRPAVRIGDTVNFIAFGGSGPYFFEVYPPGGVGGTIDPVSGTYRAPTHPGVYTIRVWDASDFLEAVVTVIPPVALEIWPRSHTLTAEGQYTFSAYGGIPPYSFSIFSGGGTYYVVDSYMYFTAPNYGDESRLRVTDNVGAVSDALVFTVTGGPLSISPSVVSVSENGSVLFSGSGGTPPYTFSIRPDQPPGAGSLDPVINGLYNAINAPVGNDAAVIRLSEKDVENGDKAEAVVTIVPAAPTNLAADGVSPGDNTTIRLTWKDNSSYESAYSLERKDGVYGVFSALVSLPPDTEMFEDTGLSPVELYIYRIRAETGTLFSAWSNEAYDFAK